MPQKRPSRCCARCEWRRVAEAISGRTAAHPTFDLAEENSIDRAYDFRRLRGEPAEIERQREDPLPDRKVRKHSVDEVRGRIGHDPPGARRTGPADLAGERDDPVEPAVIAANAKDAVLGETTTQVLRERVVNVPGQRTRVGLARQLRAMSLVRSSFGVARSLTRRHAAAYANRMPTVGEENRRISRAPRPASPAAGGGPPAGE